MTAKRQSTILAMVNNKRGVGKTGGIHPLLGWPFFAPESVVASVFAGDKVLGGVAVIKDS
ncbi:MAG TPA: hypothetical protein PKW32_09845 [Verrucomicrobiota bacterium]|nr:hypothetical protein [Verrucomicrobiota bacterium]